MPTRCHRPATVLRPGLALLILGCFVFGPAASGAIAQGGKTKLSTPPAGTVRLSPADRKIYRQAFEAVVKNKWSTARKLAAGASDPGPAKIIEWTQLRYSRALPGFTTLATFIKANPHWPHQRRLAARLELAAAYGKGARSYIRWAKQHPPRTTKGRVRLGEALIARGRKKEGENWIRQAWTENRFRKGRGLKLFDKHQSILRTEDHLARLDRLLWRGKRKQAKTMLDLLPEQDRIFVEARIALMRRSKDAKKKLALVPKEKLSHPGLLYERIRWLRRERDYDEAMKLLATASPTSGLAPHKWWQERQILTRRALRRGEHKTAYRLASRHGMSQGTKAYTEAEWFAGWIALNFRKRPKTAKPHFDRFREAVRTPVSVARASHWLAQTAAAAGRADVAAEWYQWSRAYPSTFYGQLSYEMTGHNATWRIIPDLAPEPAEKARFDADELVRAVRYLKLLELPERMDAFLYALVASSKAPDNRKLVADLATEVGRLQLSVRISKLARQEHVSLGFTGYPRIPLPAASTIEPALAYAIIRQESEFREEAVSHVGARGLMQLMPGTARRMAKELGLKYQRSKLLDPELNMTFGTHYLSMLLEMFDGNYAMAAAGHNAGEHRVERWIKLHGDPRTPNVDMIEWIEQIPFSETRNYVQRVMENLQIYRALEAGGGGRLSLSKDLNRALSITN